jgi:hypothetical protein
LARARESARAVKRRILHLNLYRHHFEAIASGEKRVEYRAATHFWKRRIEAREYDEIVFRNGYRRDSPLMRVEYRGWKLVEREGAQFYALELGKIL